ncbi:hypothetical protein QR680_008118 [Steinernema hermaphroditum]|uniref:RRM domain-containing protein n=1 Tax=Steinernema hermaphroditum TaxID=289476 RepID=A0AA39IFF0_9BILA|nr:hypothetical protein QR680_008118 [Steinernema hermaphroditum]
MAGRDCRLYVGNLPSDVRRGEVEDLFEKYGRIKSVDLKDRRGPPFAFVEFEDARDAEDAARGRDGYSFDGRRLRVEFTKGAGPRGPGGRPMFDDRGRRRQETRGRSSFRVLVSGLPRSGSWQDLKDHMRGVGEVCHADVFRDGTGVVEFVSREDMKKVIRELDDTKFRSHEGDSTYIRVREDDDDKGRGRSRSPVGRRDSRSRSPKHSHSKSRSRSRSRSASRSKSRSRSRSHSKKHSASRSKSRSPSRSRSRSPARSKSRSPVDSKKRSPSPAKSRSPSRSP